MFIDFAPLTAKVQQINAVARHGAVIGVDSGSIRIAGLTHQARIGDQVTITARGELRGGEIVSLAPDHIRAMAYDPVEGIAIGDQVLLGAANSAAPSMDWIGRIIDAFGQPLDQKPLFQGAEIAKLRRSPPAAAQRKAMGARLNTRLAMFNTMLPIARGQRLGIFAGSGVGKTTLLAQLAKGLDADVVVIGLIGERGRELRDFIENAMGAEGMKRAVVIVATSDQSPLIKRRAAWMAMATAETFRDQGKHVLLLLDSITRFAEAHREIALTAGEAPSLRAYPPSTANMIAQLAERAGPGPDGSGDITAVFTVLVAGSDMEEPVADITRGVLDGHIVLDRSIAERGRFPAADVRRSVSRCLPGVASEAENALIARTRRIISAYEKAEPMIQTGLYVKGSDTLVDEAITFWPKLDSFFSTSGYDSTEDSFSQLAALLGQPDPNQKSDEESVLFAERHKSEFPTAVRAIPTANNEKHKMDVRITMD
ncbi:MAG: FliI/YscN family ATPase [Rhodobacteraceae bacterium]|nr:FliI/YscN family ATPase [Paracoccaceae bacterium]